MLQGNGDTISIGQEIQCLLCAGFLIMCQVSLGMVCYNRTYWLHTLHNIIIFSKKIICICPCVLALGSIDFLLFMHGIILGAYNLPNVMGKGACTSQKKPKKMVKSTLKSCPENMLPLFFAIFVPSSKVRIKIHTIF